MEVLNDEEKSESTKSDLVNMWYTGYKESNIQDFEDERHHKISQVCQQQVTRKDGVLHPRRLPAIFSLAILRW
jgi:hypothetical protein